MGEGLFYNQRVLLKIATDGCSALWLWQQVFTFLKLQAADLSILVSDLRVPLVFLSDLLLITQLIQPQQRVQTQTSKLVFVAVHGAASQ